MPGSPRLIVSSPSALFSPENGPDGGPAASWTVTALRESPRTPGRYVVTLSDGRSLVVGVAGLTEAGATRVGAVLSSEALGHLVREAAVGDLVARAVGMLARGRRTRRELEIRLRRKDPDRALVAVALERLEAAGLIADQDVARAEAAARLRRGEAPARIRQLLRTKGVDGRDAAAAVAGASDEEDYDESRACHAAAAKRMRSVASLPPAVARRRLVSFLQRRGFAGPVIRVTVDALFRSLTDPRDD